MRAKPRAEASKTFFHCMFSFVHTYIHTHIISTLYKFNNYISFLEVISETTDPIRIISLLESYTISIGYISLTVATSSDGVKLSIDR